VQTELIKNLLLFGPEVTIVAFLVALFILDATFPKSRGSYLGFAIVLMASLCGIWITCQLGSQPETPFFSGMVIHDGFGRFFRYLFFVTVAAASWVAFQSKEVDSKSRTEFALLILCVLFGMNLMAISTHLLMLYLAIETVSIVSFAMAGFKREDLRSNEAALKYLVFGAFSSGIMLYGISLIYGLTGSMQYTEIATYLAANSAQTSVPLTVALLMIFSGFAYKISAFPFHFWTPDVYEGAPTPVVAFFSVAPKAAGFAALIRFIFEVLSVHGTAGNWQLLHPPTLTILSGLAVATMVVGNFSALWQTNVKRIMAYSSIAHVGYMLMGLVTFSYTGLSAILFYLVVYAAMNLGAFWVISLVADCRGGEDLKDFGGTGWTMPVAGACMAVFLFSLTGLPFFSGFIGKFLLFGALVQTPGLLWLALIGVLNSVVSLYYYMQILRSMYFDSSDNPVQVVATRAQIVGIVLLAIPTILFGLYFTPVIQFVERSLTGF